MPLPYDGEVWSSNSAWAWMYNCDPDGIIISPSTPILNYCYIRNISISTRINWEQRASFGNPIRNLESADEFDIYACHIGELYASKSQINLPDAFTRDRYLQLEFWLMGEAIKSDETHVLKSGRCESWSLLFEDNDVVTLEATFVATTYKQQVYPTYLSYMQ